MLLKPVVVGREYSDEVGLAARCPGEKGISAQTVEVLARVKGPARYQQRRRAVPMMRAPVRPSALTPLIIAVVRDHPDLFGRQADRFVRSVTA